MGTECGRLRNDSGARLVARVWNHAMIEATEHGMRLLLIAVSLFFVLCCASLPQEQQRLAERLDAWLGKT